MVGSGEAPRGWVPFEEVARGEIRGDSFTVKLWNVHRSCPGGGWGCVDERYRDPVKFFERTYFSHGLRRVLASAVRRIVSGRGEPVVLLYTGFGGGKSHTLLALYHVATRPGECVASAKFRAFLESEGLTLPADLKAAVSVFDGAAVDPVTLRRKYGSASPWRFILGELASAAGAEDLLPEIEAYGDTPPGYEAIGRILAEIEARGYRPVVLIDDLGVYMESLEARGRSGEARALSVFLYNLAVAASNSRYTLLAVASPQQYGGLDEVARALQGVARVARPESIVGPGDAAAVLRNALLAGVDPHIARGVVEEYRLEYEGSADKLPPEASAPDYPARMEESYPFHPLMVRELYSLVQLRGLQGTRDALRITAWLLHHRYRSGEAWAGRDFILLGDVDPRIRGVREVLSESEDARPLLESAAYDLEEVAARMDGERLRRGLPPVAGPLYSAILIRSMTGGEMRVEEAMLAVVSPLRGVTPEIAEQALDALYRSATHLHRREAGGVVLYSVKTKANIYVLVNREAARLLSRSRGELRERVKSMLRQRAGASWADVVVWPSSPSEVRDDPQLKLVFLDPEEAGRVEDTMQYYARYSRPGGEAFRVHKNTLVFLVPDQRVYQDTLEAVARLAAAEALERARDKLGLTSEDLSALRRVREEASANAYDNIVVLYHKLYYPVDFDAGEQRVVFAGADVPAGTVRARGYGAAVEEALRAAGKLLDSISPDYVYEVIESAYNALGRPVTFDYLIAAFTTSPSRPMLKDPQRALRRAVEALISAGRLVPVDPSTGKPYCSPGSAPLESVGLRPCPGGREECCPPEETGEAREAPQPPEPAGAAARATAARPIAAPAARATGVVEVEALAHEVPAKLGSVTANLDAVVEEFEVELSREGAQLHEAARLSRLAWLVVDELASKARAQGYTLELRLAARITGPDSEARLDYTTTSPQSLNRVVGSFIRSLAGEGSRVSFRITLTASAGRPGLRLRDIADAFKRARLLAGGLRAAVVARTRPATPQSGA